MMDSGCLTWFFAHFFILILFTMFHIVSFSKKRQISTMATNRYQSPGQIYRRNTAVAKKKLLKSHLHVMSPALRVSRQIKRVAISCFISRARADELLAFPAGPHRSLLLWRFFWGDVQMLRNVQILHKFWKLFQNSCKFFLTYFQNMLRNVWTDPVKRPGKRMKIVFILIGYK